MPFNLLVNICAQYKTKKAYIWLCTVLYIHCSRLENSLGASPEIMFLCFVGVFLLLVWFGFLLGGWSVGWFVFQKGH